MKPEIEREKRANIFAIDLFCGAGGLTKGLENIGIDVLRGIDMDRACEFPYTANTRSRFLLKPVENIEAEELKSVFPRRRVRLLAGCAPCQTFSTYNQKAKPSDKRWWLLAQFSRLIREISPELVTMENVPRLVNCQVFDDFVNDLKRESYHVDPKIVDCADYGVPQHRHRLVLVASKLAPIKFPGPSVCEKKYSTVRKAIGKLPPLTAGEVYDKDPLHQCAVLSEINFRRIKASRPGGTWRDWDRRLRAGCHRRESGKTYPSVYGRMCWDEPAPTMTTQFYGFGSGRFGHPEQDRAISLREGAILQSFPRNYVFTAPGEVIGKKSVGRLIGNAVPVKLAEVIGECLLSHVEACMSRLKFPSSYKKS